ncbi:MAG: N-acetylglucosamine-6-phosphate deacetylase, partial [Xanthomonadaceae bacterium]|nr:N-acetylglucosamine-6-phosphate deacetylase [Xanthomonadaceae bacterium]
MINYELIHAPSLFDGEAFLLEQTLLINRDNDLIEAIFDTQNREDRKTLSTLSPNIPQSTITGILTPGFIDLQVNGGGGILFNDEPTLDGLKTILNAHLSIGTHALLPTLITPTDEVIMQALDAIEAGIKTNLNGLLGIHLEGPMINPLRKGIHKEENIHIPSEAVLTRLIEANGRFGHILITLAPETVPMVLIKRLTDAGITVFAGHTKA